MREKINESKKEPLKIQGFTITTLLAYFIIYSIIGFIIETIFGILTKGVLESRKSFIIGPFCSIYGLGAVIMILALQKFKKNNYTLFFGGFLVGSIIEYVVSLIGEAIFHVVWWDYSDMAFNINGRICVAFSMFWGILAIYLITHFNPKVDKFLEKFSYKQLKKAVIIIMIFLMIDMVITGIGLKVFFVRLVSENKVQLNIEEKYIDYASNVREERKNSMKEKINVSEIFGSHVFNDSVMKARLPKAVYKDLKKTIEEGTELNPAIADVVANEMKEWAIEKGATHYTHWFQPLTGVTAEKHDAFINPTDDGKVLLEFSGKELIKGEPDASSFPSGGLRATFEARGYTAWDCTSPAFIKETDNACILCIPTAFCSYKGEALDKKTPLLRSMQALDIQATRLLNVLGNKNVKRVSTSVGPEQEYFLVDEEKYKQRKDLIFTGRTLFGAMPPKGQEMDDHYFGIIKPRIEGFMKDLNIEAWKLGISAKTEHNEVAPAQHELAPIYNSNNVATDHNQLLMETMRRVARRHGLKCLLHEKPFAGINGSGKHNNWSMVTNEGKNLLDPGKTPHENQQFLLILASIIAAVDKHADLLRMSASTPGNDHRLGANEAPPAIISIFLGDQLEDVVKQLVTRGEATESKHGDKLASGVHSLPAFEKDATDRNRTSPFAFTGNKFEFRMVGSTQSISDPNVVLNTIVADVFADVCDRLEKVEGGVEAVAMEAHEITKELLTQHQRVIFNGNGYSDEWVAEAERRGLPNLHSMVDAIPTLTTDKSVKMFEKFGVYTKEELESRVEVLYEQYSNTINIEGLATLDIAKKQIVPAVMKYQRKLANGVAELKTVGVDSSVQEKLLEDITANLKDLFAAINKLEADIPEAQALESEAQARCYHDTIFTDMSAVREPADKLEMLVAKEDWPMPSYGDLIFEV